jgi:hypothetical protein
MSVNSCRRVGIHVVVELGVKVGWRWCSYAELNESLAALRVVQHRYERASPSNRSQQLQMVMAGCAVEP